LSTGRIAIRPYIRSVSFDDDNAMEVIGHNDKFIERHVWPQIYSILPLGFDYYFKAGIIEIGAIPITTEGQKIGACFGIIASPQTSGVAIMRSSLFHGV